MKSTLCIPIAEDSREDFDIYRTNFAVRSTFMSRKCEIIVGAIFFSKQSHDHTHNNHKFVFDTKIAGIIE